MSYATPAQFVAYMRFDDGEDPTLLQAVLTRAHSAITRELGFRFQDVTAAFSLTRKLDGDGEAELYLPSPGAAAITSVTEDGTLLASGLYELDPERGRFIVRLDSDGAVATWPSGRRVIQVAWTPLAAPDALVEAEIEEAIRLWRGKEAGFSDVVGVAGSNEVVYAKAFTAATARLLKNLKRDYGRLAITGA